MRGIKFRVCDRCDNRVHIVGLYGHDSLQIDEGTGLVYYYNYQNGEGSILLGEEIPPDNSGYFLMQYTGLKDKNDKEIYEGDICKVQTFYMNEPCNYVVKWHNSGFRLSTLNTYCMCLCGIHESSIEIIGNIYENPELLEVSNEIK